MNKLLAIFCFLYISCCCGRAAGQEVLAQNYTVKDGLPSNVVYEVYRDKKGFLWFGTNQGVARYNGLKFETFTTFDGLADNEVFTFQEDRYGRLWMGTYNGALCYYKDGVFHSAKNTAFLKLPFKEANTVDVRSEFDSSITIALFSQSRIINIENERVKIIYLSKVKGLRGVPWYFKKIPGGKYLLVMATDVQQMEKVIIDEQCNITSRENYACDSVLGGFAGIQGMHSQDQNYLRSYDHVLTRDFEIIKSFEREFRKKNLVCNMYSDGVNTFWATQRGLIINDTIHAIPDESLSSITQDNYGNYWVSSLTGGVYCINKDFRHLLFYRNAYAGSVKYAKSVDDNLFFSTSINNLYRLQNRQLSILFDYSHYTRAKYLQPYNPGFFIDKDNVYYSFYNGDNYVVNNILSKPVVYKFDEKYKIKDGYKAVLSDDRYIYLAKRDRIFFFDPREVSPNKEIEFHSVTDSEGFDRIFGIAKDINNEVWYTKVNHILKVSEGREIIQHQFGDITFNLFCFSGSYLMGYTQDNRLLICNNVNSNSVIIDSSINQNLIWKEFYELDKNHVLVTTNKQNVIITLYPSAGAPKFSVMPVEDPFVPVDVDKICSDSADCYFFKDGSITKIPLSSLLEKSTQPKLFFTSVKAGKKEYAGSGKADIAFADAEAITVYCSTIASFGRTVLYQYSISKDGKDKWNDLETGEINLIHPAFGDYTVKVRAKTISSDYTQPVTLELNILKPYWAQWWFIALAVVTLMIGIGVITRQRIKAAFNKREKEHETQVRFMRSEYKALNALMNPHFIFNTLNNVQSLYNGSDKRLANKYMRIFANLIRQNMHNVSKELIPLQKEIDLVRNYLALEKLRFEDRLQYAVNVDEQIDVSEIMIPPLLIQPLVENSIKHGILPLNSDDGAISVDIYERDNTFHVEVRDNGVGMGGKNDEADSLHESFGLDNIRKRVEQLSIIQGKQFSFQITDLRDSMGGITGTLVTITFPLSD